MNPPPTQSLILRGFFGGVRFLPVQDSRWAEHGFEGLSSQPEDFVLLLAFIYGY